MMGSTLVQSLCNSLGVRIIHGRVYRWSYFESESRKIFSTIDQDRLEALRGQYPLEGEKRKARENQVLFVYLAHVMGLQKASPPLRILDVGAKAGMFPFIAHYYGHDAWASDLPATLDREPNAAILRLLQVPFLPLKVEAFKPIEQFDQRFDLITGFRTRFHSRYPWETGKGKEEHWGVREWDFFLRDLALNHLTEQGRIYFMLNRLQEMEQREVVTAELDKYFRGVGARLDALHLFIPSLDRLRSSPVGR